MLLPDQGGDQYAVRVTLTSLMRPNPPNLPQFPPPDFSAWEGEVRWIGPVANCIERENPPTTYKCARTQCEPFYTDWFAATGGALLHLTGSDVIPSSAYDVQVVASICEDNETDCTEISPALRIVTTRWADVSSPFQAPSPSSLNQPTMSDLAPMIDKFKGLPNTIDVSRCDISPNVPDGRCNIADVADAVNSFKNMAYHLPGPQSCP